MPALSLMPVATPWEGTSGSMVGGIRIVWGFMPGPSAFLCLVYLELVPQD